MKFSDNQKLVEERNDKNTLHLKTNILYTGTQSIDGRVTGVCAMTVHPKPVKV